jgi:hypothetical protein
MVQIDAARFPLVASKMQGFPDNHYAQMLFQINEQNITNVEEILTYIADVPNLDSRIAGVGRDKSKEGWESLLGELEFCKSIKHLSPEFVPETSTGRTPDLKVSFEGQDVYFEVKSLVDLDYSGLVYSELSEIDSPYVVSIENDFLNRDLARSLLEEIKGKITSGTVGRFSAGTNIADYEVSQKPPALTSQKTIVVMGFRDSVTVLYSPIRRKLFKDFYSKESQLSENPYAFLVFVTKGWRIEASDIKDMVYGTITCLAGEENVLQERGRALDLRMSQLDGERRKLLSEMDIFPSRGAVNMFDGLFWNPDSTCLSGVIVLENQGRILVYPNPFVRKEVDAKVVRQVCSKLTD